MVAPSDMEHHAQLGYSLLMEAVDTLTNRNGKRDAYVRQYLIEKRENAARRQQIANEVEEHVETGAHHTMPRLDSRPVTYMRKHAHACTRVTCPGDHGRSARRSCGRAAGPAGRSDAAEATARA